MLVTRILGDCPSCGGKGQFGNVAVIENILIRGCKSCQYKIELLLPEIRKKVLYLDQFFFSCAFRDKDTRFIEAAQRIREISSLQLLVAPFSSVHEDETHQWRGYSGQNKDDLMDFIKATSRGHQFRAAYNVEETQVVKALQAYLKGEPDTFVLEQKDAVGGNIHLWDGYFRIDVGGYMGDVGLIRDLKQQTVEQLVDIFPAWRQSTAAFDEDIQQEMHDSAVGYLNYYFEYVERLTNGDHNALLDAPIISKVVESLLYCFPSEVPSEERIAQIVQFFQSSHFSQIPYQYLGARIYATLKDMVKKGAYTNRKKALKHLNGFFQDVKHVSIYGPYCDAFVLDKAMASLVSDGRVDLPGKFGVKVFSLNNWDEFFDWLDTLEAEMSSEHRADVEAVYP